MPKNENRRQKSLQRHAAKRKQKKQALVRQAAPVGHRATLRAAAHWPLYECLISDNWEHEGELVQILISRSSPDGLIAAAGFLVDLGLLGVKDALSDVFTVGEYEDFRGTFTSLQPMKKGSLDLAAKIIREGIAYADQFGFKPNRDYAAAAFLLEGADPNAVRAEIPLGMDGKPTFVAGPHDNIPKVMAQLDRVVGPGNYHFILPIGDDLDDEEADDILDLDEEDREYLEAFQAEDAELGDGLEGQPPNRGPAQQPGNFWSSLLHRDRG
jgi:hypothetical protein